MEEDDEYPVMQITDPTGEVFYMPGNDASEATASFGVGCIIEHGHWTHASLEEEG